MPEKHMAHSQDAFVGGAHGFSQRDLTLSSGDLTTLDVQLTDSGLCHSVYLNLSSGQRLQFQNQHLSCEEHPTKFTLSFPVLPLAWHLSPCPAPSCPANGWLAVGICSRSLDASGSSLETCSELASRTEAPGKEALWEW